MDSNMLPNLPSINDICDADGIIRSNDVPGSIAFRTPPEYVLYPTVDMQLERLHKDPVYTLSVGAAVDLLVAKFGTDWFEVPRNPVEANAAFSYERLITRLASIGRVERVYDLCRVVPNK